MNGTFFLAPMRAGDLEPVAAIERETLSPWGRAQIEEELERADGFQLVARLRSTGTVAGYVCVRLAAGEAEVFKIAVAGRFRRQGVATALLARTLRRLRQGDVRNCFLELRETNVPARLLYEKSGFEVLDKRKNYYTRPREDALLMGTRLGSRERQP